MIIINANSFSLAPDFLISPYDATVTALYVICFLHFLLYIFGMFVQPQLLRLNGLIANHISLTWETYVRFFNLDLCSLIAPPLPHKNNKHSCKANISVFLTWTLRSYCQSISCVIHFMFLTGPIADHILKGLVIFMLSTWTPQSIANYTLLARDIFLPYI